MEGYHEEHVGEHYGAGYGLLDKTQFKESLRTFIVDLVLQLLSWMVEEEKGSEFENGSVREWA
ncbi:hypothetical protein ACIQZI_08990 [Peribacillus sp. NPDC096379]|uniref:hypothetical protein n=1 Tax=Peribacillus sp. NPDC096379 TaxID=3364393 RepID=UPI00382C3D84